MTREKVGQVTGKKTQRSEMTPVMQTDRRRCGVRSGTAALTAVTYSPAVMMTVLVVASRSLSRQIHNKQLYEKWLQTLPNDTIVIYTDGTKLTNSAVGCGWAIYHYGEQQLYQLTGESCHLGHRAEVYDTELQTVQETITTLLTTTMSHSKVFTCIHNRATINILQLNKSNHEYTRRTIHIIDTLRLLGWSICTIWYPSHCNIQGNKRADTLAKQGAFSINLC
jgi:ribonuclease HI